MIHILLQSMRKTGRALLAVAAIGWFVIDELVWRQVQASFAWLHRQELLQRLEDRLRALPPYAALALFILPGALTFPAKILALWLAVSSPFLGLVTFTLAKLVSSGLCAWIYKVTRERLLEIGWFRPIHDKVVDWHASIVAHLARLWRGSIGERVFLAIRASLRRVIAGLRRIWHG